jgi:hypothetical protein
MAATNFYDDLQDWLKNKRGSAGRTTVAQDSAATMSWVTQGFNGPPPSAHLGLDPGFTPNYEALIRSDPAYLSWRNSGQLDMSSAAAARKAALDALAASLQLSVREHRAHPQVQRMARQVALLRSRVCGRITPPHADSSCPS